MTGVLLARVHGKHVRAHASAFGAAILLAVSLALAARTIAAGVVGTLAFAAVALALVVGSVVLVQWGHAVAAQSIGLRVRGITFFALSGVPEWDGDESSPGALAFLACFTPALHLIIGATLGAFASVSATQRTLLDGLTTALGSEVRPPLVLAGAVAVSNLSIAIVSAIPAHPLEGGRLLHAALWKATRDRARSLVIARKFGVACGALALIASVALFAQAARDGLPQARVLASAWLSLLGSFLVARGTRLARARVSQGERHEESSRVHRGDAAASGSARQRPRGDGVPADGHLGVVPESSGHARLRARKQHEGS